MLPLYATCDYAYFRPRQIPRRAERLIHHVVENTWCEPSFSDQIVQRTSLCIHTLSSKRPTCNNIDYLLNFETVEGDKDSLHHLLSDEDTLKLTFSDALTKGSIPNLVLPHIKCNTIDVKSAATLLEERGLLNFMEESAVHNEIQQLSSVLDPLAGAECDMIRYAPMTHDTVDVFRTLQSELANTYTGAFSHHAYIETIPLLCHPELHMNETQQNLVTQNLEHLLHPKPVATPMLLFNCKGFNETDNLLGESAVRAMTSQFHEGSVPAVGAEILNTEVAEQEQWQQLLPPCPDLPAVTFYGDVGEILPNFATESAPSHSLTNPSSSAYNNGYNGTTMGPNAVQAVLAQIQRTHTPFMTRTVAHSNNSGSDHKRVFMYSSPLLAHFAGSTQRLVDLQSPWKLMPCQPNRKWHRASHNNTQAVHSPHTTDVVVALEVGFKPLCRVVPVLRASPVHSRALRSPVLDEGSGGGGEVEMSDKNKNMNMKDKRTINEMQEFVETASMNAIPDQDEEESVEVQEDVEPPVLAKRLHEGDADGEYKKRRVENHNGDIPPEVTDGDTLRLSTAAAPQAQIQDVELTEDPSNPFPIRGGADDDARKHFSPRRPVASNADPPLEAHVQLAILPVLPAVDSHPTTFVHRASTPPSPPTRRHFAPSNDLTEAEALSFHLPSLDFNFDFNAGGEGGLVEQYLRLQRGEPASVPTRGAPAGLRAAHASSVSRTTGSVNYVTPQRPPSHTTGEAQASLSTGSRVSAGAATSRSVGSVGQVTPAHSSTYAASVTAITDRDAVHLRVQQLAAHNVITFRATDHPLTVLISEAFLEQYFTQVAEGLGTMGVVMLDCPLQEPVSLILDAFTAVCVVRAEHLQNTELKVLVKKLSEITFKFTKIHVIVVLEATEATQEKQLNKALLTLTQAVSRFPAAVCLRQCAASPAALVAVLEQLCSQSLRDAATHLGSTGVTARHFHRPFLDHLQHCDAKHLAHCEYLQLFPTLNFYTAAALLYHHPLRELVGQRAGVLCDLFAKQYVPCEEVKDMVKSFVALLEAHAGLQLGADVV